MFKKSLALLLAAMMILSCFTTVQVFASDASASEYVTLTPVTVAYEDFSDYLAKYDTNEDGEADTSTSDKNIVYAYPSSAVTGYGWAANWSTSATEYVEPVYSETTADDGTVTKTDDKIWAYRRNFYETSTSTSSVSQGILKLNMGKTAYRQLATPLTIGETDGVYSFSVDVMHVNSSASARRPFRFDVGGLFSFGFDHELTASDAMGTVPSYAVPVISVGETDTSAETKLSVGGGSSGNPEYVTYTVTLNIDADGADTITLTAQDRQTYQFKWTNVSADISTVTVENADINGTINYIGLGGTSASSTASEIQNIKITKSEAFKVTDKGLTEELIAEDKLGTDAGYTKWSGAVSEILPSDNAVAGTGFANDWSGDAAGTASTASTVTAGNRYSVKSIYFGAENDAIYRKLAAPVITSNKNGTYTFKFYTLEGMGGYAERSDVFYHIGNGIKVGYRWTADVADENTDNGSEGEITPFIQIGENEPVTGGTLITYGGYSQGEYVEFEAKLDLYATGRDLITLTARDKSGVDYGSSVSGSNVDLEASVTVYAAAELSDEIEYIGATIEKTGSDVPKFYIGGFEITGAEAAGEIADDAYPYIDIAAEYQGTKADEITEYGFDGEWTANADGTGELDISKLYYESKSAYIKGAESKTTLRDLRLASENKITSAYRQLADAIYTNGRAGSYTFTFDVADGMSGFSARAGLVAYFGEGIEFGYTQTSKVEGAEVGGKDAGLITPYIKVGDAEAVTNGTLKQYGSDDYGEFTTFTVKVDLAADGMDRITLTAQDNPDVVVNTDTTNTTESVTVVANADITAAIAYIGFVNEGKVDIRDIAVKGYGEPVEQELAYPVINVAADVFGTDGDYTAWTGALSANLPESGTTGYGFANNWSGSADGTAATIDKVQAATNVVKALRLETLDAAAYRKLAAPVIPKGKDGEYTFTFAAAEGNGNHSARSGVAYHLGDDLEIGYNWTTLVEGGTSAAAGKITPYVKVGGNTLTNGDLTTYGGYNIGEYVAFRLNIKLDADGSDLITLTVKDKETDTRDDYKNTDETVTISASAQLADVIDYIGFDVNADGSTAKIDICDIAITGTETPVIEAVNTTATTDAKEIFGASGGYTAWSSGAISAILPASGTTGYGFANNWMADAEGTTATADKVQASKHKIEGLRLEGAVSAYRRLAAPVAPAGKSGTYTFKFSSVDQMSSYSSRNSVAYHIGENIEVGYDWTEDITTEALTVGDSGYITPYIAVNGTKISDESKKLTTYGNSTYGEWVDFELKVELGENGSDLLTLTVKDNTNTIAYNDTTNGTTTNTDEVVTLTAAADIGEAIEYIGFETKGGKTDFANIEIVSSKAIENQPRTESQWTIAEDTLDAAAGYSFETITSWKQNTVLSSYIPADVTESGWSSNWAADTDGTALGEDVVSYTKTAASGAVNTIRLVKGTSAIYRSLETPLNLTNANASYTFIYSTASGNSSVANRSQVNFHIGDVLAVGHTWDGSLGETEVSGDPSKLVPFIKLANGSEALADDYLRTLGNDSYGELVTFEIKVDLFKDGLDTVTVTAYDRADNIANAAIDDKKVTIQLAAELSGTVDYIGFSLDGSSGERKTDITDLEIKTYNEDGVDELITENIGKMGLGYGAARIIDTVVHPVARETLITEFNRYGYAYEDFGAYEAAASVAAETLDGGAGWDGAWSGTTVEVTTGHSTAAGNDIKKAQTNLSRKLKNPIDLSVDGEYYVKVKAYVDIQSANISKHNLNISAGNFVFGTAGEYNESGASTSEKYLVKPVFGTEGTANSIENASTYPARNYNTYVLRIVSSASGDDTLEYFFAPDGVLDADAVAATATVTSDDVIDTISITDGAGATLRLNEIAVDCWNDSFKDVKDKAIYDEGVVDGSAFAYYSDYKKAVDENNVQLPECVTTDYMLGMSDKAFIGIIMDECVLRSGTNDTGYTNVTDISALGGSTERNLQVKVTLRNTGLIDKDGSFQAIHMLVGYYYDGKLMGVKRQPWQLYPTNIATTNYISYDFPTDAGWPEEIDYSKVDIKVFTFDWHTWAPFDYVTEFYNSRTVIDTAEKIYVSPSYEGDTSDGSEAAPYETIEEAQEHIANLNANGEYPVNGISVYIEPGDYMYATNSLEFTSDHSGTAGAPVKYVANGGEVNIVGGIAVDLSEFEPTTENDAVYNANVVKYTAPEGTFDLESDMFPISGHQLAYFQSGTYNKTPYFTVAVDEKNMTLARWPNASVGYAVVDSATSWLSTMTTTNEDYPLYDFTITDAELANKNITGDNIYIHGYWTSDYADFRTTAQYDAASNTFTADYPAYKEVNTSYDRRYYVSNSPDLLDAPGEWYIDGDTLYLYPETDSGMVTVGLNVNPVIKGDNVDNIIFDGINIKASRGRGATFGNCDNITFKNASITNVNDSAAAFNACTGVTVDNCTVAYTGTGGITMGGTTNSFKNQISENNVITNSTFHDFGLWQKGYSNAITFGGYANIVENNKIYNTSHQAVSMSGFNNVFRRNEVYDVVSEASDMGAIYVGKSPSNRGNIIEQNYFHDIKTNSTISTTDIAAIFLDDICAGYTIRNNVFENMGGKAMKTNGGRAHIMTGNVFINNYANAGYSCNGLGYDETDGYFMWTEELLNTKSIGEDDSIRTGFNKYWGYILADSNVADGTIKEAPFSTTFTKANGYAEDIATYYDADDTADGTYGDEPLLAKYNIFKDNFATGCTTDYYFKTGQEGFMTDTERSGCEFASSADYDASKSMSSYIGIELSEIGPQK